MIGFFSSLTERVTRSCSLLCVGLDPHPADLPAPTAAAARDFCLRLIETTADLAAAFKPNMAFFEQFGAEGIIALQDVIAAVPDDIPVVLDAKRGDIASTAEAYARAAYETLGADAITLSPYLGRDSLMPFLADPARGVFLLCKTSNPGAGDLQDLPLADRAPAQRLFERVAELATRWNENDNLGLVVGATHPEALAAVRRIAPDLWILAPGVGAQGGDLETALRAGLRADGLGLLLPVSRQISRAADPRQAALALVDVMRNAITQNARTDDRISPGVTGDENTAKHPERSEAKSKGRSGRPVAVASFDCGLSPSAQDAEPVSRADAHAAVGATANENCAAESKANLSSPYASAIFRADAHAAVGAPADEKAHRTRAFRRFLWLHGRPAKASSPGRRPAVFRTAPEIKSTANPPLSPAAAALADRLLDAGCVRFGQFTLKSGLQSPIYLDLRQLISHPSLLTEVSAAYTTLLAGLRFDRLAALPYAALPIATAISLRTGWPMIYPRKEVKAYGTAAEIEGEFVPGERAVVIDDLATTGGSKFEGIEKLTAAGLQIEDVAVLIDRCSGASEALAAAGYRLHAVMTLPQMLDHWAETGRVPAERLAATWAFLEQTAAR